MTTTTTTAARVATRRSSVLSDTYVVTWRYLKRIPRIPETGLRKKKQSWVAGLSLDAPFRTVHGTVR